MLLGCVVLALVAAEGEMGRALDATQLSPQESDEGGVQGVSSAVLSDAANDARVLAMQMGTIATEEANTEKVEESINASAFNHTTHNRVVASETQDTNAAAEAETLAANVAADQITQFQNTRANYENYVNGYRNSSQNPYASTYNSRMAGTDGSQIKYASDGSTPVTENTAADTSVDTSDSDLDAALAFEE